MSFSGFFTRIKEFGRLAPIGLISLFLPIAGSSLLIVFLSPVGNWLRENWEIGVVVMLTSISVLCGLSLIPTNVIGVVSGWAFGFQLGLAVLIAGIVAASYISFQLGKRLSGNRLENLLDERPRSRAVYQALIAEDRRRTTLIVTLLRLSVVTPFAFTNFVLAAAKTPTSSFLIGSAAGMLPRAAATAFVGAGLSELDLSKTDDTVIFALGVAGSVVSLIVLAFVSRRALANLTGEMEAESRQIR